MKTHQNNIKKILSFCLFMLFTNAVTAQKTNKKVYDIDQIASEWSKKAILLPSGGKAPNVLALFRAVNGEWTTQVGNTVLLKADHLNRFDALYKDDDTEFEVEIDLNNGYIEAGGMGDGEYMSACVWKRNNGHRLLAVELGKPVNPDMDFVIFYDYNPASQKLTPETALTNLMQPRRKGTFASYLLPQKGKTVYMREVDYDASEVQRHFYEWDGQTFKEGSNGGWFSMPQEPQDGSRVLHLTPQAACQPTKADLLKTCTNMYLQLIKHYNSDDLLGATNDPMGEAYWSKSFLKLRKKVDEKSKYVEIEYYPDADPWIWAQDFHDLAFKDVKITKWDEKNRTATAMVTLSNFGNDTQSQVDFIYENNRWKVNDLKEPNEGWSQRQDYEDFLSDRE